MQLADELREVLNLIADDIELLVLLHDKELDVTLIKLLKKNNFPRTMGFALQTKKSKQAMGLMQKGIDDIKPDAIDDSLENLAADYASIYLNYSLRASPYESVWLDEEQLMMQGPMFEIRRWYEKYGLKVADWRLRSDDHFICQLQFVSRMLRSDEIEHINDTANFMDQHLFRWFEKFCSNVANRCDTTFYAGLAALSFAYIDEVRDILSKILDTPRPSKEEIEARFSKTQKTNESVQYIAGSKVSW